MLNKESQNYQISQRFSPVFGEILRQKLVEVVSCCVFDGFWGVWWGSCGGFEGKLRKY